MADVLAYWHGDMDLPQVRGIGYLGAAHGHGTLMPAIRPRHTATVSNRAQTDMWPELDLLRPTFGHDGVAQLETSRGCTNFCSFCPRGHKGQWAQARKAQHSSAAPATGHSAAVHHSASPVPALAGQGSNNAPNSGGTCHLLALSTNC
jgi:hypothetical protein